jgi:glycosyltransferase involved in cell wall biosynthesis
MKLSIITINRNNAAGLEKTMQSVVSQTYKEFEYVVVDGASTDDSVEVIKRLAPQFGERLKWISEPDKGIYNAMNKGMRMASGDYFQILNSADCLASDDVTERMLSELEKLKYPTILYGNMVKCFPDGHKLLGRGFVGQPITMLNMYNGTLNHDPTYIHRSLFEKYGYYDESLFIVSDWKWFLTAIILGGEEPKYTDINVTLFDMTGVSENVANKGKIKQERKSVMEGLIPKVYLADYERYSDDINMMKRIHRHKWAYKLVWFVERCLFKIEKRQNKKKKTQTWG